MLFFKFKNPSLQFYSCTKQLFNVDDIKRIQILNTKISKQIDEKELLFKQLKALYFETTLFNNPKEFNQVMIALNNMNYDLRYLRAVLFIFCIAVHWKKTNGLDRLYTTPIGNFTYTIEEHDYENDWDFNAKYRICMGTWELVTLNNFCPNWKFSENT